MKTFVVVFYFVVLQKTCCGAPKVPFAIPNLPESFSKQSGLYVEKRELCAEGGGDQIDGCPYFAAQGFCDPSSLYYQYVTSKCEASCGFCQMPPTPPPAVDPTSCLNAHNQKRDLHGAPPLVWDNTLAQDAKNWADHLAMTDSFYHEPGISEGENLFWGSSSGGAYSCLDAVESWYSEIDDYDYDNPPETKAEFNSGPDIGHFTQVVWRGTISVGAALKAFTNNNGLTETILVARYSPRGNILGQFPENVNPVS